MKAAPLIFSLQDRLEDVRKECCAQSNEIDTGPSTIRSLNDFIGVWNEGCQSPLDLWKCQPQNDDAPFL